MKTEHILNSAIRKGQEAAINLKIQLSRPLSDDEIRQRFTTLTAARDYIASIQPALKRLAELENARRSESPQTETPTPPAGQTLEQRYRARVAAAEAEVERAKGAVLEAPSPQAQIVAMRELRMKEQRLNFERRNFQ